MYFYLQLNDIDVFMYKIIFNLELKKFNIILFTNSKIQNFNIHL